MRNFTLLGKPGDQGGDGVCSVQLMSVFTRILLHVRTVKEQENGRVRCHCSQGLYSLELGYSIIRIDIRIRIDKQAKRG